MVRFIVPTRIFATARFTKFTRREHIADTTLVEAIARVERGLVDADLGGGLIKQRVARKGKGKSGGYRMLLAYRENDRAVFLFAFAKNELDNINQEELSELRGTASNWLNAQPEILVQALEETALQEIRYGREDAKPLE